MACPMSAALCTILSLLPYNFEYQTPADLASPKQLHDGDVYDFIIVGAGPAGSVLANRLSEIPSWKVLLLESGGEESKLGEIPAFQPFLSQTRFTWNYTTVPDDRICAGAPCLWVTGRGLGGGSLHNNMIYNRGNSHTFDEWEQMGNAGWGYEEMLYYFKKSENNQDPLIARNKIYHSTKGPQTVSQFPYVDKNVKKIIETFHQLGYPDADINGVNQTGVCLMQHLQKDGGRQSSAKSFLYPIREKRNNLKIVTNVRVTKVIINPQTKEAEGVEYTWENKRHVKGKVYARKEVIISTGPMATTQLLMLSGVGPNKTLVPLGIDVIQNLPVGQNYQNHIQSGSLNFTLNDTNTMMPNDEETLRDFLDYFTKRRGPLASEGFFDVSAFISSRYTDSSYPDVQINFYPRVIYESDNERKEYLPPMCYYNTLSAVLFLMTVESRGYVTINTTDPFSYPLIYPNLLSEEKDMNALIDGYNFLLNNFSKSDVLIKNGILLDRTPLEQCKQYQYASDDYWRCHISFNIESVHHFSGSCKMGPSNDPTAVVDPQLRVHGIKNLRVADSSIQPKIVNGNTNAIALAIGEKAGDLIKKTWIKNGI